MTGGFMNASFKDVYIYIYKYIYLYVHARSIHVSPAYPSVRMCVLMRHRAKRWSREPGMNVPGGFFAQEGQHGKLHDGYVSTRKY